MSESQVDFTRLKISHVGNGSVLPLCSVGTLIWKNVLIVVGVVPITFSYNHAILSTPYCLRHMVVYGNYYLLIGEHKFISCITRWCYTNEK